MTDRRTGPHIIVMEDEPLIRGLVAHTLRRHDYVVDEAADGDEALALLRDQIRAVPGAPVLMILDLAVPNRMGGAQTLVSARALAPDVKAIIASGLCDVEELHRLQEPGRTAILSKPFDMNALLASVTSLAGAAEPAG